jgi:hypothetical protein
VLSAQVRGFRAGLRFFKHGNDLLLGKTRLPHGETPGKPLPAQNSPRQTGALLWGDVNRSTAPGSQQTERRSTKANRLRGNGTPFLLGTASGSEDQWR